jgi:hypothetical protein
MTCTCATLYFPRKILRHRHSPFPSRLDARVPFPTHSFTLAPALSITWHFSERLLNVGFFYFDRVSAGGRRSGGASNRKRSRNKGHLPTQRQERTLNSYLNFVFVETNCQISNEGMWRDEVDPAHPVYTGPVWLEAYPAPLEALPYFTRANPLQ